MKLHDYFERYMKTMAIIKKYFLRKNLRKSVGLWVSIAVVLVLAAAFQNCGSSKSGKGSGQGSPNGLTQAAPLDQTVQGCTLASPPISFEPNPPGVPRVYPFGACYSNNLSLYQRGAGGPWRILMEEAWGYSILDISNPLNPTALLYHFFPGELHVGGDGQSMVATIAVSPDGARAAFSLT